MLTTEALQERKKGIGASEAARIVSGDWFTLWQEKTGRAESKAILTPWDLSVRHALEPVIMDHYEARFESRLELRGGVVISPEYPIIRATLDGYCPRYTRVVDAKALNLYVPEPMKWCVSHYAAQMQHQMLAKQVQAGALYISIGMKAPEILLFEYDEFWALDYVQKCEEFWNYVRSDMPPPGGPVAIAAPAPEGKKEFRTVDMTSNNEWAALAADWLANKKPAAKFEKAAKDLKAKVDADVGEASGHGITIKRAKNNALSIKKADDDE